LMKKQVFININTRLINNYNRQGFFLGTICK
jgi:hypothetical protein